MQEFRDVLDECGFKDLGYIGAKFTWCNGRRECFTVWERLDRVVATMDWLSKFPATRVVHFECGSSDHKQIIIMPLGIPRKVKNHGNLNICGWRMRGVEK